MKLVTVSGLWGSGKTSLIKQLVKILHGRNKRSGVIVNEAGEVQYDSDFLGTFGATVESLRGG